MTYTEFKRWLEKRGCSFAPGKRSHLKVRSAQGSSILPVHGKKEIGKGLVAKIKKDLGLK